MNQTKCSDHQHSGSFVTLAVFSIISGLIAFCGNLVVLLAIYKTQSLRTNSNLFIASLAGSDWLVGCVMQPLLVYKCVKYSYFGDDLRENDPFKVATDFLWIQAILVTTFGLTAVSVDRFIAITMVFRYKTLLTVKRCGYIIIFNWTFSFLFASMRLFLPEDKLSLLWLTTAVLSCGLPFAVTFYCYAAIFKAARTQMRRIVTEATGKEGRRVEEARHRKTAWTIGIVITLFFFLWFPSLVIASINLTLSAGCTKKLFAREVWLWVELVAYSSSSINPWVYSMRSVEFRAACKQSMGFKRSGVFPEGNVSSRMRSRLSNAGYRKYDGSNMNLRDESIASARKGSLQLNHVPTIRQYNSHLLPPVS